MTAPARLAIPTTAVAAAAIPAIAWASHVRSLRQQLEAAGRDELTGAWRRTGFTRHANQVLDRYGDTAMLLFADIDYFKQINDSKGHAVGDQVLIATARRLAEWAGSRGVVGRLSRGADEFAVACRIGPARRAIRLEHLITMLRQPVDTDRGPVEVAVSVGAATPDAIGTRDLSQLMRCADYVLMQRAKHTEVAVQAVREDREAESRNGRVVGSPGTNFPGVYAA